VKFKHVDNGDGTITDLNAGLMWEKKSDDGSIHDKDTRYAWDAAFAVHVTGLNGSRFAGHADWRIPNRKELSSLVNLERDRPSVDPVFDTGCVPACTVTTCSCTASSYYWSATSYAKLPSHAWYVFFIGGFVDVVNKSFLNSVRAVRGGIKPRPLRPGPAPG